MFRKYCSLLLPLVLVALQLPAQPPLELTLIANGLSGPTDLDAPKDGSFRLYVAEKEGTVKIVDLLTNNILDQEFLDLGDKVATNFERGLLGLAFDPDYATTGHVYISYSASGTFGGITRGDNVISRLTVASPEASTVDLATEEVIITVPQEAANHNGGDIAFGPDGYLYIGIGDGGGGGDPNDNGQNGATLLATILRIDVRPPNALAYAIPPDNPFVDSVNIRDEIWALGMRNPWRISFDRETGDFWVGDVGQNAREEINFEPAGDPGGHNYGWDCREGLIAYNGSQSDDCLENGNYRDPIVDMDHFSQTMSAASITGGYVYRGGAWPDLQGVYICADFSTNNYFLITPDGAGGWDMTVQNNLPTNSVTTFGESENGELYVTGFSGRLYQVGGGMPSSTRNFFTGSDFTVSVSPNPVKSILRVDLGELTQDELLKVRLVDAQGRPVLNRTWSLAAGPQVREMHLPPGLPAGMYQLLVTNAVGGKAVPIIVE